MSHDPCSQEINDLKGQVHRITDEVNDVRQRLTDLETRHTKCLLSDNEPNEIAAHVLILEKELPAFISPPAVAPKPSSPAAAAVSPTVRASVTAEFNGPLGGDVEHAIEETPNVQATVSGQIPPRIHVAETTTETRTENGTSVTKKIYVTEHIVTSESKINAFYQNGESGKEIRVIGLQKRPGDDHLVSTAYCARVSHISSDPVIAFLQGLTVRQENGQLVIARLLDDSPLAKQGIVHVGDSILEVNGFEVKTAEDLKRQLKDAETVTLKIVPTALEAAPPINGDARIPSKQIGLAFKVGDILQVVSKEDPNWWQARKVTDWSKTGVIPSQHFEETRRVGKPQAAKPGQNIDQFETPIYEEVGRLTPYGRRVLVLLGAPGVGRRTLKARLLKHDEGSFASITPFTSRKKRDGEIDGREYNFVLKDKMQQEIERGQFLEWGEFNGNFYGTKLDSVRQIIRAGRMCILDSSPQALKYLYNREFMPFVLFLAPPPIEEFKQLHQVHPNRTKTRTEEDLQRTCEESERLEVAYKHYFDLVLVNRNAEVTFRRLLDALESLKNLHQWVPVSWIFG